jgi:hypothetical protein
MLSVLAVRDGLSMLQVDESADVGLLWPITLAAG